MESKEPEAFPAANDECPECLTSHILWDHDTGEKICRDCGLVIQIQALDSGPESRVFTPEEKERKARVGMPASYANFDKGLSTTMSDVNHDFAGRRLPLKTRVQMLRLKRWQVRSRVRSSVERNLVQAMTELDRLSDKLNSPDSVKEKAAVIYRKALEKDMTRGRSIKGVVTASLYAAYRSAGIPRNLKEIVKVSLAKRKEITRDYRLILRELNIQMPISDPASYLAKISDKAKLSSHVQKIASDLLEKAKYKKAIAGKDPVGLAAAALYIASRQAGSKIGQKEIAEAADVTEVTIRNRYKILTKQLELEFD